MTKLLFINHIITGDVSSLKWWTLAIAIMAALVILASVIDLVYGIKASKAAGIFQTSSYGLRKTIEKDVSYMMFFLFSIMIDGCLSFFVSMPVCSIVVAVSEIIIEAVSVMENRKRAKIDTCNPLDVARAIIKTFGISDAGKIEEVINYIRDHGKDGDKKLGENKQV